MKTTNILKSMMLSIATLALPAMFTSCSSEDELAEESITVGQAQEHKMVMQFNGDAPSFDKEGTRATSTGGWIDGATILLRFCDAEGTPSVSGKAQYKASTQSWELSYYGSLISGKELKCYAYYFEGVTITDNNKVDVTPYTAIYATTSGSYFVDNGEIVVNATLTPQTARIMFKGGTVNTDISVGNLSVCKSFTLDKGFTFVVDSFEVKIDASGKSNYIYGFTSESCLDTIAIVNDDYEYKKKFISSKFAAGESGYIEIPSQDVNKGWVYSEALWGIHGINLGLSVRWAETNIISLNPGGQGTVCSWGDAYGTNTSTSSSYNQYINIIAGDATYDIATRTLGSRWHIPTRDEWTELFTNCTLTTETVNGVKGVRATAKNGNSIFLPCYGTTSGSNYTVSTNSCGFYWSSTAYANSSYYAYHTRIYVNSSSPSNSWDYGYKYYKMCIRPVYK